MTKSANTLSGKTRGKPSPEGGQKEAAVGVLDVYLPTLPLIDGEIRADYEAFHASCLRAVKPVDAVETVWLQDFIDYTWEAQRLKKVKAALIQEKKRDCVERLLMNYSDENIEFHEAELMSMRWSKGDRDAVEHVETMIEDHGLGDAIVMAKAMDSCLQTLERIDKLIAAYNYRRDAALRELEKRRDFLAMRARDLTVLMSPDAEVIEVKAAE